MRFLFLFSVGLVISVGSLAQNVGIGTSTSDPSSLLELNSKTKGFLLPRLTTTEMNAITNPAWGLAVFNTDSNSICIFNSTSWQKIIVRSDLSTNNTWNVTGNSGTSPNINFIGTTDNKDLAFRVNNLKSGYISLAPKNRTSLGYRALLNDTALNNTALGFEALLGNVSGSNNIAIGTNALKTASATNQNIAIGTGSMQNSISGTQNVAIGSSTLQNTTASNNTAVGFGSLMNSFNGGTNTATGTLSLASNTYGTENEAFGYGALYNNTVACGNVAVGNFSLFNQNYANSNFIWLTHNTAIGYHAMQNNNPTSSVNGNRNTALGANSLLSNTTGSNNTALGYGANVATGTLTNATALGANAIVSTSNSIVLGNNVNVGVGTSSPASKLHVATTNVVAESIIESDTNTAAQTIASKQGKTAYENFNTYSSGTRLSRWSIGKTNDLETGSNEGSNFEIKNYNDAGNLIDKPLVISRATGTVTIPKVDLQNVKLAFRSETGHYTVTDTDYCILYEGVGSHAITLPSSADTGRVLNIINHGSGVILISPGYKNTSTLPLATGLPQGNRLQLIFDGLYWHQMN